MVAQHVRAELDRTQRRVVGRGVEPSPAVHTVVLVQVQRAARYAPGEGEGQG